MARLFTNDGSANNAVTVAAQGFTAWGFGTLAAVVYQTGSTDSHNFILVGTPAQDYVEIYSRVTDHNVDFYNGGGAVTSTPITQNEWMLVAVTKDTGNVTPRLHLLRWSTGSWTHAAMSGPATDPTGTGATEHSIGFNASFGSNSWFGHALVMAMWKSKVMTDGEVERLGRGLWDLTNPDLLMEFPSGRDNLTRTTIDCSRNRMRQTVSGSQVTRSNIVGPPGFQMSALNRRR